MEKETIAIQDNDKVVVYELEKKLLPSEKQALRKKRTNLSILVFVLIITFTFGYLIGTIFSSKTIINNIENNDTINEISDLMNNYWLYSDNYENLNQEILTKSLKASVNFEFDPYTEYLTRQEVEEFTNHINMNFTGIGVLLDEEANKDVYIAEVFKNSPAEKVGIMAGDLIVSIDGINVLNQGTAKVRSLALGAENTKVKIDVKRLGQILSFEVIRKTIDVSIEGELKDDYYYLKVATFGENTVEQVKNHLLKMKEANVSKLIIDLRNNGGGYLTAVTGLLGLFLEDGAIALQEEFNDGSKEIIKVTEKKLDFIDKVVILQNNNSASSSEVFIMGMKEQFKNTITVGTTTYGKGVVQSQLPLSDGSTLKITISKWLSSQGVWIDKKGILADVEVHNNSFMEKPYKSLKDNETLKLGDVDEIIAQTKNALAFLGYDLNMTAYYDEALQDAIIDFQTKNHLTVNGIIDIEMQRVLVNAVSRLFRANQDLYDLQLKEAIKLINE